MLVDGHLAYLTYKVESDHVVFDHTYVPETLRGRGIATHLARESLTEARRLGWKVAAHCPFVAVFVERHREFVTLIYEKDR